MKNTSIPLPLMKRGLRKTTLDLRSAVHPPSPKRNQPSFLVGHGPKGDSDFEIAHDNTRNDGNKRKNSLGSHILVFLAHLALRSTAIEPPDKGVQYMVRILRLRPPHLVEVQNHQINQPFGVAFIWGAAPLVRRLNLGVQVGWICFNVDVRDTERRDSSKRDIVETG